MQLLSISQAIHALELTMMHSLWLGAVIYCLHLMAQKLVKSARVRYNLAALSMAGMVVFSITMFLTRYLSQAAQQLVIISQPDAPDVYANAMQPVENSAGLNMHLIVAGIYVFGVAFMLFRLLAGIRGANKLRSSNTYSIPVSWEETLNSLKQKLGIRKTVRAYVSENIVSPVMMGFIKPVILLPANIFTQLSAQQLEAVLLHELAHIKRNDYLINILQTVAETLLFFNPFLWMISADMRKEREYCCDDIVLKNTGTPLPYAQALTLLASQEKHGMAMAAKDHNQHLFTRIKRMMEMRTEPKNSLYTLATILGVVAIVCMIAVITPSFGQNKKDKKKTEKTNGNGNATSETEEDSDVVIDLDIDIADAKADSIMQSIDFEEIEKMVTGALIEIDSARRTIKLDEKIGGGEVSLIIRADSIMQNIDWESISEETSRALRESQEALKITGRVVGMNSDAIKEAMKSLEGLKGLNMTQDERAQLDKAMEQLRKATESMPRDGSKHVYKTIITDDENSKGFKISGTPQSMSKITNMLKQMEEDGLIDNDEYRVEKKDDKLYINGKVQTQEVYNRYKEGLTGSNMVLRGGKNVKAVYHLR